MPLLRSIFTTIYDIAAFQFSISHGEQALFWFAGARLLLLLVDIAASTKKAPPPARLRPHIFDFSPDEQRAILEASVLTPSWVTFPDLERVEWLNTFLQKIWLSFGTWMNHLFKETIQPIVQDAIGTKIIFRFETVNFGTIPLRLSGVKAYRDSTDRREVVLDLEVYYNGDAELMVYVAGVKAGLKNIQIKGTLRIVLKPLLSDMPFIGGIEVFFMNEPTIDFDMTNLLNAPGFGTLKSTVMSIAKDNIRWFLVLPNKISVPFGETHYKDFMFVPPVGIVRVHVVGGRNLPITDRVVLGAGSTDPYVVLQLGAREARTKSKKKTLNPVFDEMFDFIVTEPQGQTLILTLFDADMVKDEVVGDVKIDIGFLQKMPDTADYWHFISGPSKGQLHIRLSWLELTTNKTDLTAAIHETNVLTQFGVFAPLSAGILMVLLDSAQSLPMIGNTWGKERLPNPSVVLTLSAQKFVSRVVIRTQNPVWEQFHIFYVNNPLAENLSLVVKDDISPVPLGTYTIPLTSLLDAESFQVTKPFMLLNSGPQSFIKLRVAFRVAISAEVRRDSSRTNLPRTPSVTLPTAASSTSSVSTGAGASVRQANSTPTAAVLVSPPPSPAEGPRTTTSGSSNDIPVLKSRSLSSSDLATTPNLPRIKITILYRKRSDDLLVEVVDGAALQALRDTPLPSKMKVFVSGTLYPTRQTYYSDEISYKDQPAFKGKFVFLLGKIDIGSCTLLLKVVCGTRMNQVPLGEASVSLQTYDMEQKLTKWFELSRVATTTPLLSVVRSNDSQPSAASNNTVTSPLSAVIP